MMLAVVKMNAINWDVLSN